MSLQLQPKPSPVSGDRARDECRRVCMDLVGAASNVLRIRPRSGSEALGGANWRRISSRKRLDSSRRERRPVLRRETDGTTNGITDGG